MSVELRVPTVEELRYRQGWLADPEMMAYNAGWEIPHPGYDNETGCLEFPESEWPGFLEYWSQSPNQRGFFYIANNDGEFLGETNFSIDADGEAEIGVVVSPDARGGGVAADALQQLIAHIWQTTDATAITNTFEDTRHSAIRLHQILGFRPEPGATMIGTRPVRKWVLLRPPIHDAGVVEIRRTVISDASYIHDLNVELGYEYPLEETRNNLKRILGSDDEILLSACVNDGVVGYVHAQLYLVTYSDPMYNVMGIVVARDTQGKGVGKKLLAALEREAMSKDVHLIRVNSGASRTNAHRFYESAGYGSAKNQVRFIKDLQEIA